MASLNYPICQLGFNYPQQVEYDRRELELEGKNVEKKRYLSLTGDNSRILITSNGSSRDILSCDVTGGNCVRIGESLVIEGNVTCVKCCDTNNFVIGTEKGYLIKFVSGGTGRYQRQQLSQISCPGMIKCVMGLSADSPQFSAWWCVTGDVCYKVGTHNWEVKHLKDEERTSEPMLDIVIRDEVTYVLFCDEVRMFNIINDKLQLPSRIIRGGMGTQLQIVNDDVIIAGWMNGLCIVNIQEGDVVRKWEMSGYNVTGVDVDFNNKIIYVLTLDHPSCLLSIKC